MEDIFINCGKLFQELSIYPTVVRCNLRALHKPVVRQAISIPHH